MTEEKTSLTGLSPEEICSAVGLKEKYRGKQIFEWLNKSADFDQMTNLPADIRNRLNSSFKIFSSTVVASDTDSDNTAKIALQLFDGLIIEAVLLSDENSRKTACLSSQAGCAMGCTFCRTGKMGLRRNLRAAEIIEQYMHLKKLYGEIDNIVYMGMGEPLKNTYEVIKSLLFFTGDKSLNMSARRITISTCGVIEGINRLTTEAPPVRLAVSLVSADPDTRARIMPVTKKNSLPDLKKSLLKYQEAGGRRITLECAIIRGINDSPRDASLIADWAEGLSVNVNVIPWNPASEIDYKEPEPSKLDLFCRELDKRKITYTRRFRRGRGLNAACGQLATGIEKKPADSE